MMIPTGFSRSFTGWHRVYKKDNMTQEPQINVGELKRGGIVKLKEKDMYSIWVKTACCNLTSKQLRKLADITSGWHI